MEPQIAAELLKIAAELTETTLSAQLDTKTTNHVRRGAIETVFSDCLATVTEQYENLLTKK